MPTPKKKSTKKPRSVNEVRAAQNAAYTKLLKKKKK
jgi:hypothetical protein